MHTCVIRAQYINSPRPSDAHMRQQSGLSPGRRQAIIWTSAGILWIEPLGINSEILIEVNILYSRKCIWNVVQKMGGILFRPRCVKPHWYILHRQMRHRNWNVVAWTALFSLDTWQAVIFTTSNTWRDVTWQTTVSTNFTCRLSNSHFH